MGRIEVSIRDVEAALPIVREVALHTPLISVREAPDPVWLKLENLQRLGSFKIRGATNRLARLSEPEARRGISTISSGNHGLAVAWSARRLDLRCTIRVPEGAAEHKVDAIRSLGADVTPISRSDLVRAHWDEGWRSWPETFIHPFAHPHIIAGQATIGLEIAEDAPDVRTVLVPVGGGGLASGIAIATKARLPDVKVFGVQAEGAATLPTALRTRRGVRLESPKTIADGIRIGILLEGMAELMVQHLDGCFIVSDDEIRLAMRRLALESKVVAEPAGAAAYAAWMRHAKAVDPPVVVVVSGGNVDPKLLRTSLASTAGED